MRILDSKDKADQEMIAQAPRLEDFLNNKSKSIYSEVCDRLDQMGITYKKNPLLVRGLDYYTHCVFEFKSSNLGAQDTVLAGGRYNDLIPLMGGPNTVGVGWASGIERLNLILQEIPPPPRPISLIPLGEEAEIKATKLIHQLRSQGLNIDISYSGNLNKRMKKAHKVRARAAIIIGHDELAKDLVQLKDFDTGNQKPVPLTDLNKVIKSLFNSPNRQR